MRFHQAVTFLPTLHALELAMARRRSQGYDGSDVSDHMFFPRERQSRYTYSTREDGAPGSGTTGTPTRTGPTRGASSPPGRGHRTVEFTTGVYIAPARDLVSVAK